jgi:hypothetical protein
MKHGRWSSGYGLAALFLVACTPMKLSGLDSTKVTVCELLAKPEEFSGKQVTFHATLMNPRRKVLVDGDCGRVLLVFPGDEEVRPKAKFQLLEDDSFKQLMDAQSELLPMPPKKPGRITATFEGRFDSVFILRNGRKVNRDPRSILLAADEVRLVLRRVSDVKVDPASD